MSWGNFVSSVSFYQHFWKGLFVAHHYVVVYIIDLKRWPGRLAIIQFLNVYSVCCKLSFSLQ